MEQAEQKFLLDLNRTLANFFVLYVKLHRYKWFLQGEHALLYERFFERIIPLWHERIEQVAHHILSLGGKPFATMQKYVKSATLNEANADDEEEEIFEQLRIDMENLCEDIEHTLLPLAKKIEDTRSLHLLSALLNDLYHERRRFITYEK